MDKIELNILGISSGHTAASYTLILEEKGGQRKLPVVIGAAEAQSIAVQIEGIKPVRPMTHDLMRSIMDRFILKVDEVIISKLEEGIFYADLYVSSEEGQQFKIDARTSDAIALAIRFQSPIYTSGAILDEAGIVLTEKESEQITRNLEGDEDDATDMEQELMDALEDASDLQTMTMEELEDLLSQAIDDEDYDVAAKIRDEIQSRQNN